MRRRRHASDAKPFVLITTNDPDLTLGEGIKVRYRTLLEACNAFCKTAAPYKTIIFDDAHGLVRDLDNRERTFLGHVCRKLGYELA
jgi:hypothetical protein